MNKWMQLSIVLASLVAVCILTHQETKRMLADDCAKLNQTVIGGQWYICKPHNPNPKRVM